MERYQMNGSCGCGQQMGRPSRCMPSGMPMPMPGKSMSMNRPPMNAKPCQEESMYRHVDRMIPAMAYVPYQTWQQPFSLDYALRVGTIFPDLCKPFCGRRTPCR